MLLLTNVQESILKSDAPSGVKYLQTMVECLALLGKVSAGGSIIRLIIVNTLCYEVFPCAWRKIQWRSESVI